MSVRAEMSLRLKFRLLKALFILSTSLASNSVAADVVGAAGGGVAQLNLYYSINRMVAGPVL
jgi:hypothetical protein